MWLEFENFEGWYMHMHFWPHREALFAAFNLRLLAILISGAMLCVVVGQRTGIFRVLRSQYCAVLNRLARGSIRKVMIAEVAAYWLFLVLVPYVCLAAWVWEHDDVVFYWVLLGALPLGGLEFTAHHWPMIKSGRRT